MNLNKIEQALLLCLLMYSGSSYAEGIGEAIANTTHDWARALMQNFNNDAQHSLKRAQGKEVLKHEEARNDAASPLENPSDWDSIESSKEKCWFHKRTRKKVCEMKVK